MKRCLLFLILLVSTVYSQEDVVVTTNGDSLAGITMDRRITTSLRGSATSSTAYALIGEDSTSSTAHTVFLHYAAGSFAETWTYKTTRPYGGGYTSAQSGRALALFRGDTTFAIPSAVYSGSNMQARMLGGANVLAQDTISPSVTVTTVAGIACPPMRLAGDTMAYAICTYDANLDDNTLILVRTAGAWSQSVSWGVFDTLGTVISSSDWAYDYCGSGVILYDRTGRDAYWFNHQAGTIATLGTDIVPAGLSTTKKYGTDMICMADSNVYVMQYCSRDSTVWRYRFYATGGSNKTGLTLVDSLLVFAKTYFTGNAVDSLAPMCAMSSSESSDERHDRGGMRYYSKLWFNTSNLDSVSICYVLEGEGGMVAPTQTTPLTSGEVSAGKRFYRIAYPRHTDGDVLYCLWQESLRSPDTIWCSRFYDNEVIQPLTQVPADSFSTKYIFQGTTQVEDAWLNGASKDLNYGATTTLTVNTGATGTATALLRPITIGVIPVPCRVVACSIRVTVSTAGSTQCAVYTVKKPAVEGTSDAADPGASSGVTHRHWDAINDLAADSFQNNGCGATGPGTAYNNSNTGPDRSSGQLQTPTWSGFGSTGAKNTTLNSVEGLIHLNRYVNGRDTYNYGWVKLISNNATGFVLHSSEAAVSTNGPRFTINVYFTEPGMRRDNYQMNLRRKYKSTGFRVRKI